MTPTATPEDLHAEARQGWETGAIVPHCITSALDLSGRRREALSAACGVPNETLQAWEAGIVYPTWDQLVALARETGVHPAFFAKAASSLDLISATLTMTLDIAEPQSEPIHCFTDAALAAAEIGTDTFPAGHTPAQQALF